LWQDLAEAPPKTVVYLTGSQSDTAPNCETLEPNCSGLLHLVQAIADAPQPPQLYVVTQGAAYPPISSPDQATLWGLGRVIALEYPALRCCRMDLNPQAPAEQQATELLAELECKAAEAVAYRQQRWVARLDRASLPAALTLPNLADPNACFRLAIASRGTPDDLELLPQPRCAPGPNEVEIRVTAAGLNFIDVLDTLGLLPFERDWLGVECAGEVVAVGTEVKHLAVGDRVVALAAGSFARYVTVSALLVVPQPRNLSNIEAATIPANFLTAYYALVVVAKVQPGERVLIHAAAGGTGMAAVQIALSRGAEVFATASPSKWAALKNMGVRQVMHSRTLDFADEILATTRGKGVDVVFNSLSGEAIPKSLGVLKPQGRFIEIGKRDVWSVAQVAEVAPQVAYHLVDLLSLAQKAPQQVQAMLTALMQAFESGQLHPLPHRVFSLLDAVSAFRYMQRSQHIGKIVLTLPQGDIDQPRLSISPNATYMITGGLGGLGLLVADWLVAQGARHLALVSRRAAADSPETEAQIQALEAKGGAVAVLQADVSQREELAAAIASLNLPLGGVIHAAGVLDDGVLQQLTWDRMETVLAPKVYGAWHLHQLTQDQPLDFFVLFSSAASLLGSPGQGSHVAANAFLDALAHHRQSQGLPALSINWGAWSGVGAAAERNVDQQMQSRGVGAIAPDRGLEIFSRLLANPTHTQVGVIPIRWSQFLQQGRADVSTDAFFERFVTQATSDAAAPDAATDPALDPAKPAAWRSQLEELPERQRLGFLTTTLQQEVARVLGRSATQLPDPHLGFFDMGLDSLMAVELKNRLDTQLGLSVSSTAIFEHPNIAALAAHLRALMQDEPPAPKPALKSPDPKSEPAPAQPDPPPDQSPKNPPADDPIAQELAALESLLNQP
ncbi:MAG: SDR family NAD(P)-dependent oxidoreductase, partial [Cyanobacteria bacterium P01_A01_bin.135]